MRPTPKQRPPEKELLLGKRQLGSGSIVKEKCGLAIRWPEYVIDETGERKRKMRYELLGPVNKTEAEDALRDRIQKARRDPPRPANVSVTFQEHAARWQRDMLESAGEGAADLYKFSVRNTRAVIIESRLNKRFGSVKLPEMSTELLDSWVAELRREGLAASTIHNYYKVLSVILDSAVTWGKIARNPAEGVTLPKLKGNTKKKWALSAKLAGELIGKIRPLKPRAMIALAITAGLRRGELLALRWKHLDEDASEIAVMEASYRGHIDTPKTEAGSRRLPLDQWTLNLLSNWRRKTKHGMPDDFIFGTRTGRQETPGNILARYVQPACVEMKLPKATWNTFRRTFSTLLHKEAIPAKTIAEMMGHAQVSTQFIYIQGDEGMKRVAAAKIGSELSRSFVQETECASSLVN